MSAKRDEAIRPPARPDGGYHPRDPEEEQMMPAPMVSEERPGMPCTIWETTFCWLVYETSEPLNIF